jgi:hypothetical protein
MIPDVLNSGERFAQRCSVATAGANASQRLARERGCREVGARAVGDFRQVGPALPGRDGRVGEPPGRGRGRRHARYGEPVLLLAPRRQAPATAQRLVGALRFDARARYRVEGLGYRFRWRPSR